MKKSDKNRVLMILLNGFREGFFDFNYVKSTLEEMYPDNKNLYWRGLFWGIVVGVAIGKMLIQKGWLINF